MPPPASALEEARLASTRDGADPAPLSHRNLFQFHRAEPAPANTPAAAEQVVSAFASAAATLFTPPPPPEWRLVGIADDPSPKSDARTAIISGAHDVFLVKEGGRLAGKFEVTRIQSETVDLRDLTNGSILTLSLKPR